jgi:hypothetical protein
VGRGQGLLGGSSAGAKAQLCLCFKLDIFSEAFLMILLRIDVVSCSNFDQREKSEQRAVKFIKMFLDNIVLKNVFTFSTAYLKLLFSLLNSNQ